MYQQFFETVLSLSQAPAQWPLAVTRLVLTFGYGVKTPAPVSVLVDVPLDDPPPPDPPLDPTRTFPLPTDILPEIIEPVITPALITPALILMVFIFVLGLLRTLGRKGTSRSALVLFWFLFTAPLAYVYYTGPSIFAPFVTDINTVFGTANGVHAFASKLGRFAHDALESEGRRLNVKYSDVSQCNGLLATLESLGAGDTDKQTTDCLVGYTWLVAKYWIQSILASTAVSTLSDTVSTWYDVIGASLKFPIIAQTILRIALTYGVVSLFRTTVKLYRRVSLALASSNQLTRSLAIATISSALLMAGISVSVVLASPSIAKDRLLDVLEWVCERYGSEPSACANARQWLSAIEDAYLALLTGLSRANTNTINNSNLLILISDLINSINSDQTTKIIAHASVTIPVLDFVLRLSSDSGWALGGEKFVYRERAVNVEDVDVDSVDEEERKEKDIGSRRQVKEELDEEELVDKWEDARDGWDESETGPDERQRKRDLQHPKPRDNEQNVKQRKEQSGHEHGTRLLSSQVEATPPSLPPVSACRRGSRSLKETISSGSRTPSTSTLIAKPTEDRSLYVHVPKAPSSQVEATPPSLPPVSACRRGSRSRKETVSSGSRTLGKIAPTSTPIAKQRARRALTSSCTPHPEPHLAHDSDPLQCHATGRTGSIDANPLPIPTTRPNMLLTVPASDASSLGFFNDNNEDTLVPNQSSPDDNLSWESRSVTLVENDSYLPDDVKGDRDRMEKFVKIIKKDARSRKHELLDENIHPFPEFSEKAEIEKLNFREPVQVYQAHIQTQALSYLTTRRLPLPVHRGLIPRLGVSAPSPSDLPASIQAATITDDATTSSAIKALAPGNSSASSVGTLPVWDISSSFKLLHEDEKASSSFLLDMSEPQLALDSVTFSPLRKNEARNMFYICRRCLRVTSPNSVATNQEDESTALDVASANKAKDNSLALLDDAVDAKYGDLLNDATLDIPSISVSFAPLQDNSLARLDDAVDAKHGDLLNDATLDIPSISVSFAPLQDNSLARLDNAAEADNGDLLLNEPALNLDFISVSFGEPSETSLAFLDNAMIIDSASQIFDEAMPDGIDDDSIDENQSPPPPLAATAKVGKTTDPPIERRQLPEVLSREKKRDSMQKLTAAVRGQDPRPAPVASKLPCPSKRPMHLAKEPGPSAPKKVASTTRDEGREQSSNKSQGGRKIARAWK